MHVKASVAFWQASVYPTPEVSMEGMLAGPQNPLPSFLGTKLNYPPHPPSEIQNERMTEF